MKKESLIGKEVTFIESELSEELILEAERIIDANQLSGSPPSNRKSPWLISAIDKAYHYQVQIILAKNTIKQYACNCKTYQSNKLCAHICASLLYIRRHKLEHETTPIKLKKSKRKGAITNIIAQLSRTELEQLIIDGTKRDTSYRLLVQGRYYALLSNEERTHVVEKSFPAITKVGQRIGPKYTNSFITFCDEMIGVYTTLLLGEDFVSAYEILFPVLRKSFYIKNHIHKENTRLLDNHKRLINHFLEITIIIEAPALRHSMNTALIDLVSSSYISANTPEEQKIWLYIYHWPECREQLLEILHELTIKGRGEDIDSYYFFVMLTLLCQQAEKRSKSIKKADSQTRYRVLQLLCEISHVEGTRHLVRDFVMHTDINSVLLRQVLSMLPVDDPLMDRLLTIYSHSGDATILRWLHQHTHSDKKLSKKIQNLIKSSGSTATMIDYLLLTDQPSEVIKILQEQHSLKLLHRYDRQLLPGFSAEILSIYKSICSSYIIDHFGASSRDYLVEIYQHLKVIGADDILKKLQTYIKKEFKNRRSLKTQK